MLNWSEQAESLDLSFQRASLRFNSRQHPRSFRHLHYHPHYELLYIAQGSRDFEINGQRYHAASGDLIIFRPGEPHIEYAGSKRISLFAFRFKSEDLLNAKVEFPSMEELGPVVTLPGKKEFFEIFSAMVKEHARRDTDSANVIEAYLTIFMINLKRGLEKSCVADGDDVRGRLKKAMNIMQDAMRVGEGLENVSRKIFMSPSHFSRSFKRQTGESPKRFVIRKRIEEAKRLLTKTDLTASAIATRLGYETPYYFYRQFKLETGSTVSNFRRAQKQKTV